MLKVKKSRFIIALILCFVLGIGACLGYEFLVMGKIQGYSFVQDSEYANAKDFVEKYKPLYEIDKNIEDNYLWKYDRDEIQEKLYKTMVEALGDKYSSYMNKTEFTDWNTEMSGKFSGIGLTYAKKGDDFVVQGTIENSPAEKAGFKKGDIILSVDGKKYDDMEALKKAIRGDKGTNVAVTYSRDGKENTATMTREDITLKTVSSTVLDGNVGYIRISEFDQDTSTQFETELKALEDKKVNGFVLDLRENGGGYVTESLKVADMLLPACKLMTLVDKNGVSQEFNSDASHTELKYALLVDGNTASASEILSAAVQENKGGPIVGVKTYGKGIVQSTFNLSNGGGVKLTTMEYLTPNGNHVHGKGITPDYVVELKENDKTDYQLNKAVELLK